MTQLPLTRGCEWTVAGSALRCCSKVQARVRHSLVWKGTGKSGRARAWRRRWERRECCSRRCSERSCNALLLPLPCRATCTTARSSARQLRLSCSAACCASWCAFSCCTPCTATGQRPSRLFRPPARARAASHCAWSMFAGLTCCDLSST